MNRDAYVMNYLQLRDYFAAAVLPAIYRNICDHQTTMSGEDLDVLTAEAYAIADQMMEARDVE
jgi:hypothetical protein